MDLHRVQCDAAAPCKRGLCCACYKWKPFCALFADADGPSNLYLCDMCAHEMGLPVPDSCITMVTPSDSP